MSAYNTSYLLSVPIKRASDIDVSKPLKNIISSTYSTSDAPVNIKERLSDLQKLRQAAIKANGGEAGASAVARFAAILFTIHTVWFIRDSVKICLGMSQ